MLTIQKTPKIKTPDDELQSTAAVLPSFHFFRRGTSGKEKGIVSI